MKKLLLFAGLLMANLYTNAQQVWVSQNTGFTPVSSGVRYVSAVDTNVVWICSYDGSGGGANRQDFSRTIDGGANWTAGNISVPADYDWSMIHGLDENTAWAMFFNATTGIGGSIYKTTDGGLTWNEQGAGAMWNRSGSFPNVVHFWDANEGFAMGDPSNNQFELYHTMDGGTTWTPLTVTVQSSAVSLGSDTITTSSTAGFFVGQAVSGTGVPVGATITAIVSNTQLTISANATATNLNASLTYGTPVAIAGEYGIVGHYEVIGDTVWFDTNKGRVYRSIDRGLNWTVSSTGITVPTNYVIDICFYSASNGMARLYNASNLNVTRFTSDGGTTWTNPTVTGFILGSDIIHVPGTAATLMSTGAVTTAANLFGTATSYNGGLTWARWDSSAQRTALGAAFDSTHIWTGGFTSSPTAGGIYKYTLLSPITCADPSITPGTATASVDTICPDSTVTIISTPVLGPTVGTYAGGSYIVSSADNSGTADPLNAIGLIAAYGIQFPAVGELGVSFTNDGTLIDGSALAPYGLYYWTPLVFGNATSTTTVGSILDLDFDLNCVYGGNSVPVWVLSPADQYCIDLVGIKNPKSSTLSLSGMVRNHSILELRLVSAAQGKASISVVDLMGRTVAGSVMYVNQGVNNETLNVENLAAGTYVIKAEINGISTSTKVVKM